MNTENNKLIASFLGWEKQNAGKWILPDELSKDVLYADLRSDEQLEFHQDWNWLMLAVEKIESMELLNRYYADFDILSTGVSIDIAGVTIFLSNPETNHSLTKIQRVYEGVIAFIQWYNQNKKS